MYCRQCPFRTNINFSVTVSLLRGNKSTFIFGIFYTKLKMLPFKIVLTLFLVSLKNMKICRMYKHNFGYFFMRFYKQFYVIRSDVIFPTCESGATNFYLLISHFSPCCQRVILLNRIKF